MWLTNSNSNMASQGSHQSLNVGTMIKYNMMLEYYMENIHGAKIYVDQLGQVVVRIDDHEIDFLQEILVSMATTGIWIYTQPCT